MTSMENLRIGTLVRLTDEAKEGIYSDMNWKNDILRVTHKEDDGEQCGKIYSFDSVSSNMEITCSMYGYELELLS